jgi:hypothetical protein
LPLQVIRRDLLAKADIAARNQDVRGLHLDNLRSRGQRRIRTTGQVGGSATRYDGDRQYDNSRPIHKFTLIRNTLGAEHNRRDMANLTLIDE